MRPHHTSIVFDAFVFMALRMRGKLAKASATSKHLSSPRFLLKSIVIRSDMDPQNESLFSDEL